MFICYRNWAIAELRVCVGVTRLCVSVCVCVLRTCCCCCCFPLFVVALFGAAATVAIAATVLAATVAHAAAAPVAYQLQLLYPLALPQTDATAPSSRRRTTNTLLILISCVASSSSFVHSAVRPTRTTTWPRPHTSYRLQLPSGQHLL